MTLIYTLADPITGEIRYIGKTKRLLKQRLAGHLCDARNCQEEKNTHNNRWIRSLLHKGQRPIIEILEEVSEKDWKFWEIYWIAQFKMWNIPLCNHHKGGGDAGYHNSEEAKKKRLETLKISKPWKEGMVRRTETMKKLREAGEIKPYTIDPEMRKDATKRAAETNRLRNKQDPSRILNKSYPNRKAVIAMNITTREEIEYKSITEAAKYLNTSPQNVQSVCKRKSVSCKGFIVSYKDQVLL